MGLGQGHTHVLGLCSAYELGTEWCPWAGDRTVPMGWGQNGAHMLGRVLSQDCAPVLE